MTRNGIEPELPHGVQAVEHTADAGLQVEASSLGELLHRAGRGMLALAGEPGGDGERAVVERSKMSPLDAGSRERSLELHATDASTLLLLWLRELLYLHEVHGFAYRAARFARLTETELQATICGAPRAPAAGELKAVTYHGLEVARRDGAWHARVIFDV